LRKLRVRRRALSSVIGGIIILALFLVALTALLVVNQQYDAYQDLAEKMSQKNIDRSSESLVAVYPGLKPTNCGSCNLNQYNMSISNQGGVGAQIIQIYINSTAEPSQPTQPGCSTGGPCVLSPSKANFVGMRFALNDSYIGAGEFNHIVRLWLPQTMALPNVTLTPSNSIWVVTSRGRVFSFSWPLPPGGQGSAGTGTPVSIQTGSMKIAYNGTYNSLSDSCHKESRTTLPARRGGGTTLSFINPWITPTILEATNTVVNLADPTPTQTLYVSVYTANTLSTPITFSWGQMVILTARSDPNAKQFFVGGSYVGIVLKNTFYPYGQAVAIQPGDDFYLIFKMIYRNYGGPASGSGDLFTGTATMNNAYSTQAEDSSFKSFVIFLDGLYVRNLGGPSC